MKYRYVCVWNDNTFTICNKYSLCNAVWYKITQLWDKSTILRHNTKLEWFINRFDLVSAAGSFFIYFREFHCTLVVEYWRRHCPPRKHNNMSEDINVLGSIIARVKYLESIYYPLFTWLCWWYATWGKAEGIGGSVRLVFGLHKQPLQQFCQDLNAEALQTHRMHNTPTSWDVAIRNRMI